LDSLKEIDMDLKTTIVMMKEEGLPPKRVLFNLKVKEGKVSEEAIHLIKEIYDLSENELRSLFGWFPQVKDKVLGKHSLLLCRSCHKGDETFIKSLSELIKTPIGEVSEDGLFSFELTGCMGMCALGPNAILDQQIFNKITDNPSFDQKLRSILEERKKP
jgi:NADH:ubiquinone oxidoreductase subunit E